MLSGNEKDFVINTLNHEIKEMKLNGVSVELENGKKEGI